MKSRESEYIPIFTAYLFEDGKGGGVQINKFADGRWLARREDGSLETLTREEDDELKIREKNGWRVDEKYDKPETPIGDSDE